MKVKKSNLLTVGFDARMVAYRQAGIGQYSLSLLRELARLQADQPNFWLSIYQSRKEKRSPGQWLFEDADRPISELPAVQKRVLWTPPHHWLEQVALPLELLPVGPMVFHSPDFVPPFRRWAWRSLKPQPIASVITIHDLAFLRFPHLLTAESASYYGQVQRAAHSAERIIAVSNSTARDVMEGLGVEPEKVRVVYEAAHPRYRPLDPIELAALAGGQAKGMAQKLAQAGLDPAASFLLFVSTLEPRKNLPTLLKAFRRLLDDLPEDATGPKLVLAGREGWLYHDIYRLADELRLGTQLVWLGGVSGEELLYLYNRAALTALPSLYEGFGLPPLESLACGCPALVADTSSLPEVVGTVGLKLPPEDVSAWATALLDGWQQRDRYKRVALATGPSWAASFSWQRAATQTLAIYREANTAARN